MAYAPFVTAGTQLKLDISGTYTNVPGVEQITSSGGDKTTVDVTAISDTAAVEIGGKTIFGSLQIPLFWDPLDTVHQAIYTAAVTSGSTSNIKISFPTATARVMTCTGGHFKLSGLDLSKDAGGKMTFEYVMSGAPTFGAS